MIEKCQTNDDTGPEAPPEAPNRWRRIASNDHRMYAVVFMVR